MCALAVGEGVGGSILGRGGMLEKVSWALPFISFCYCKLIGMCKLSFTWWNVTKFS